MLQYATAAGSKMDAARFDPMWRSLEHLNRAGFVEMAIFRRLLSHHPLAGQGAGDEHGLSAFFWGSACSAGYPTAVVAQIEDVGFKRGFVDTGRTGTGHVAKAAR
jgi:hypothetical protein